MGDPKTTPYRESAACPVDHNDLEAAAYQRGIDRGRKLAAAERRASAFWDFLNSAETKGFAVLALLIVGLVFLFHNCNVTDREAAQAPCLEKVMDGLNSTCRGHIDVTEHGNICRCSAVDGGAP